MRKGRISNKKTRDFIAVITSGTTIVVVVCVMVLTVIFYPILAYIDSQGTE